MPELLASDIVVNQNEIWLKPNEAFQTAPKIECNFSDDFCSGNIVDLFDDAAQINWIVANEQNMQIAISWDGSFHKAVFRHT